MISISRNVSEQIEQALFRQSIKLALTLQTTKPGRPTFRFTKRKMTKKHANVKNVAVYKNGICHVERSKTPG